MRVLLVSALAMSVGVAISAVPGGPQPANAAGGLSPGERRCFEVEGSPGDVAVVNLTPVRADGRGYGLLVPPDVTDVPDASNVNFDVGTTDPNVATAAIGVDGTVCYINSGASTHLVADHLGTISADAYTAAQANGAPLRMVDTRGGVRLAPGVRRCFAVAGSPGDTALVNLTPVRAQGRGYGLLVSSDVPGVPVASSVNFDVGTTDPNVAAAAIGADGQVCYLNSGASVHLIADHLGTIDAASFTHARPNAAPLRKLDTRGGATLPSGARRCFAVAGSPGDVALVNVTPVKAHGRGYGLLVSSDITGVPEASNVNFDVGTIDPNVALAAVGAKGEVCYLNSEAATHMVADHVGSIAAESYAPATSTGAPHRVVDTREWRPDVYLNFHGSEQLLGATDARWRYVRANLDGFWGHWSSAPDHESQVRNTIDLTRKVAGRKLVAEHAIASGANGSCVPFMHDYFYAGVPGVPNTGVEGRAPDIRYDRVAAALYAGENPDCWGPAGGIFDAIDEYQDQGYDTTFALYQATNLISVTGARFPLIVPGSPGDLAYRNAGGVVIECQMDDCLHPSVQDQFFGIIEETHARGASFVWFTGYHPESGIGSSGWLAKIQRTYNAIAERGLWHPGDAVTLINYHGSYPALPERRPDGTPADTVTGVLAWLLEQRPLR